MFLWSIQLVSHSYLISTGTVDRFPSNMNLRGKVETEEDTIGFADQISLTASCSESLEIFSQSLTASACCLESVYCTKIHGIQSDFWGFPVPNSEGIQSHPTSRMLLYENSETTCLKTIPGPENIFSFSRYLFWTWGMQDFTIRGPRMITYLHTLMKTLTAAPPQISIL